MIRSSRQWHGSARCNNSRCQWLFFSLCRVDLSLRWRGEADKRHCTGVVKEMEYIIQTPCSVCRKGDRFISTFPEVWTPVAPTLVDEVQLNRFTGGHFRHGTSSYAGDLTNPLHKRVVSLFVKHLCVSPHVISVNAPFIFT